MNRSIKFRAWAVNEKIMLTDYASNTLISGGIDISQYHSSSDAYYASNLVLMQFTGIEDKNGTQIYEGDILSHDLNNKKWIISNDGFGFNIHIENNTKYEYEFMTLKEAINLWNRYDAKIIVCGNIYENH